MMNILVTGANGFVGSALCVSLSTKSHIVFASSRLNLTSRICKDSANIKHIPYHVTYNELPKCNAIIHLAGRAHVMRETNANPYIAYQEVNVHQSIALAKQAIKAEVKRFIFVSSVKVLGESTSLKAYSEDDPCFPEDDYGKSKLEAEIALKNIFQGTNTELVIIRPPLIYGKGVKANFKNLISLCSKPIPLPFGALINKRSLIYLENLIDFIELCCSHHQAANQTFLVSDDYDVSTTELIQTIKQALKKPSLMLPIPEQWFFKILKLLGKQGLATRLCGNLQLDISKAKTLLGWQPPFTFEQGIQKTVDAFQQDD